MRAAYLYTKNLYKIFSINHDFYDKNELFLKMYEFKPFILITTSLIPSKNREKKRFFSDSYQKLWFLEYYVILGRAGPDRAAARFFGKGRAVPGPGKILAEFSSLF